MPRVLPSPTVPLLHRIPGSINFPRVAGSPTPPSLSSTDDDDDRSGLLCHPAVVGNSATPRSVRLSVPWRSCPRRAVALGYMHAGCLQLSHVRTADRSADGRRSPASRTAINGGHIVSPPPGR